MGVWKSDRNEKIRNAVLYSPRPLREVAQEHGISIPRAWQIAHGTDWRKPVNVKLSKRARRAIAEEAKRRGVRSPALIARVMETVAKDGLIGVVLGVEGEIL